MLFIRACCWVACSRSRTQASSQLLRSRASDSKPTQEGSRRRPASIFFGLFLFVCLFVLWRGFSFFCQPKKGGGPANRWFRGLSQLESLQQRQPVGWNAVGSCGASPAAQGTSGYLAASRRESTATAKHEQAAPATPPWRKRRS